MRFLQQININTRLTLFINAFNLAIVLVVASFLYSFEKRDLNKELDENMDRELTSLVKAYEAGCSFNEHQVATAAGAVKTLFDKSIVFTQSDSGFILADAYNQVTESRQSVKLKHWMVDGRRIYGERWLIDQLAGVSNCYISVLQKIPEGYIQMCTNLKDHAGNPLVDYLIPNSSEVVAATEKGISYKGKVKIDGESYLAYFEPILSNGITIGLYSICKKEFSDRNLEEVFYEKKFYHTGSAFLLSRSGHYLLHPSKHGQLFTDPILFGRFKAVGGKTQRLDYSVLEYGNQKSCVLYYTYHKETESYICIDLDKVQMDQSLAEYRAFLIRLFVPILLIIFFSVYLICLPISNRIRRIVVAMKALSNGQRVEPLKAEGSNEVAQLIRSLNKIIAYLEQTATMAKEIGKGVLTYEYSALSAEDSLGNSLLEMRGRMAESLNKQKNRQKKEDLQKWAAEGVSLFNDILRTRSNNLQELSQIVIKNFIDYIGANQGAIFLMRKNDNSEDYFEMLASYAYDRLRNQERTIPWGAGLIGRSALEKKLIYITDIPDGYMSITSGLGESTPNHLIVAPLLINEEAIGAVELASFEEIPMYKREFISQVASMVAVTINTVVVNQQTSMLLQKFQKQSKDLEVKEEVMRRNFEELQATQETSMRKDLEQKGILEALYQSTYLFEFDVDGNVIDVNQNFVELLGVSKDHLVGRNHRELSSILGPVDACEKHWQLLKNGNMCKIEEFFILPDQRKQRFISTYTPIVDIRQQVYKVLCISSLIS